jgi:hypothetical protein
VATTETSEAKAWISWPLGGTAETVPFPKPLGDDFYTNTGDDKKARCGQSQRAFI